MVGHQRHWLVGVQRKAHGAHFDSRVMQHVA